MNADRLEQLRSAFKDARHQYRELGRTLTKIGHILEIESSTEQHDDHTALYDGPIEIGQHFIWEKDDPRAWAHLVVTRIDFEDSRGVRFDERRIWTRVISTRGVNAAGSYAWNEEGRCREAFTPCDERGSVTV